MRAVLKRWGEDRAGHVGMMTAAALVPLVGLVGGAVDYNRAAVLRAELERAVDAAALSLVRQPSTASQADIQAAGQAVFSSTYGARGYASVDPVTVTRTAETYKVAVAATSRNAFLSALGFRTTPVAAAATATGGRQKIELALVLDNTGSMRDAIDGQRKIDALKKAAKDMLARLRTSAIAAETIKVSVVPFDTEVRLPTSNRSASWLHFLSASDRQAWTGYVVDRYQPYDLDATSPTTTASGYPGLRQSEYSAGGRYGNLGDIATVRPLTSLYGWSDYQDLVSVIDGMTPRGNTDIALGFAWGLATLSPGAPYGTTLKGSDPSVKQFMVLLTDGENTQNHIDRAANFDVAKIDDRTQKTCANVKTAGVEVFTIRLLQGNESLLKGCASGAAGKDHYFDVQSTSDLDGAFRRILDAIAGTRLTS